MGKIVLFYKYVEIEIPGIIEKWQRELCESLGLKGRIILATEGINGTLGGSSFAIDEYIKEMNLHPLFSNIDFKLSDGDNNFFPRLKISIKNEIVRLGIDPSKLKASDGGIHLTPAQTHELLSQNKEDLIVLDIRNNYESAIGIFENALISDIENFRDFPGYIDKHLEKFKDKKVLMYCTGGVRCERATAYLKTKDIAIEIYQIEGGICRYVEQYPDGFFKGSNYVFDARISCKVNNITIGQCLNCSIKSDFYLNCLNSFCNKQFVTCNPCVDIFKETCSSECLNLVNEEKVPIRKIVRRVDQGSVYLI